MKTKTFLSAEILLLIGLLTVSTSAIMIRWAQSEGAPSLAIASWRLLFASAILIPFAIKNKQAEIRLLTQKEWALCILAGFALSLHFASWFISLEYTTVANSTLLVTTSPLFISVLAPLFLKESNSKQQLIGLFLAMIGSLIITLGDRLFTNSNTYSIGSNPFLGNILALVGAITVSIYFLIGRYLREKLSILTYITIVYSTAALCLILITLSQGIPLFPYSQTTLLLCLAMAIFPQLLGHTSFNYALATLPVIFVSIATLGEPIGSSILAWFFFTEIPPPSSWFGALFIFVGILYARQR